MITTTTPRTTTRTTFVALGDPFPVSEMSGLATAGGQV